MLRDATGDRGSAPDGCTIGFCRSRFIKQESCLISGGWAWIGFEEQGSVCTPRSSAPKR